ncbi:PREDICTED: F-box only protein 6-like isoform X1 [Trachymyrmex septentrionalis]|nr:PREDICTED: F-box only protein 6-like isoform X1 [Trachymyrmex septentrionalis]XP_018354327.1 PREDICTED: F-box only protein 6-like isoform X1 [Trachymyrmex septentrionalis]
MRQFNDTLSHMMFDVKDCNGLVLCNKFLPVEVLTKIFSYVDYKTMLNCLLVCKHWQMLIYYVWYTKINQIMDKPFPLDDNMPWSVLYLTCKKKPYGRNLLKNHSGAEGIGHWTGLNWFIKTNNYPCKVKRSFCLTESENVQYNPRTQNIDLKEEGIHPYIIDIYRPTIQVSEWINCRADSSSVSYKLTVELIDIHNKQVEKFYTSYDIKKEEQNKWLQFSHTFEGYGVGVRKISFKYGELKGLKMSRTCVSVKIPEKAFVLSKAT